METPTRTRSALADAILAYVEGATGARSTGPDAVGARAPRPTAADALPPRSLDLGGIAALLDGAARLLEDDAVGLNFAAGFDFDALGPFSYAVLHAPTVGTALRNLERYSDALAVGVRLHLETEGRSAHLRFPVWGPDSRAVRHLDEAAVLFLLRMLRRLAGPRWSAREVAFRHAAPADVATHRRLLGVPLRFGRRHTRISFARSDLDRPVREADRFRLPVVERHLESVVSDRAGSDPWRQELEVQVASLVCDGHPSIRTVAPRLGLSARTLQRRLGERGICYRDLVAGVRLRIARHYLGEREPSLAEIGFLLGYSELSAFDRAFRRWTGMSPGQFRSHALGSAPPAGRTRPGGRANAPRRARAVAKARGKRR